MSNKIILALSSSMVGKSGYLEMAVPFIKEFTGNKSLQVAFIPFASVDSYDDYQSKVKERLKELPLHIEVVKPDNAKLIIDNCDAVMVGGGNTFKLLHDLYALDLIELIRAKVEAGAPYIGWSAGANITGKTISTTNDMPIIEPESFKAFNFFAFQINPHYINIIQEDHNGETRDQRLEEFIKVNPDVPVVGLPEGTALQLNNGHLTFKGDRSGALFTLNKASNTADRAEIAAGDDLTYLLKL